MFLLSEDEEDFLRALLVDSPLRDAGGSKGAMGTAALPGEKGGGISFSMCFRWLFSWFIQAKLQGSMDF